MYLRERAPHVRCDVLAIEGRTGSRAQVTVKQSAPVFDFFQSGPSAAANRDLSGLPRQTTNHVLSFRRTKDGWLADFADGVADDGGSPRQAQ